MMKKILITVLLIFFISSFSFGETILLKSGQVREGKIIERTDEYIKTNYCGFLLTYPLKDIESIDGEKVFLKEKSKDSEEATKRTSLKQATGNPIIVEETEALDPEAQKVKKFMNTTSSIIQVMNTELVKTVPIIQTGLMSGDTNKAKTAGEKCDRLIRQGKEQITALYCPPICNALKKATLDVFLYASGVLNAAINGNCEEGDRLSKKAEEATEILKQEREHLRKRFKF